MTKFLKENEQYDKQIAGITDEEGLKQAYASKDGLHQHYKIFFIAGTRDFPRDHIDDITLQMNGTLNKTKRGRDADMYYRSHNEIDTVIGHSLGGSVALALEKQYKKEGNNPYGLIQSKTFGAPIISGSFSGTNPNRIRWAGDPISALDFNSTTAPQLCHHSNSDGIIVHIGFLVCVLRMRFPFMTRSLVH